MRLGQTQQYRQAIDALTRLKGEMGITVDIRAIAAYLLHTEPIDAPEPTFPFVGVDDPRDRAVVQAYTQAFEQILAGDDDDE